MFGANRLPHLFQHLPHCGLALLCPQTTTERLKEFSEFTENSLSWGLEAQCLLETPTGFWEGLAFPGFSVACLKWEVLIRWPLCFQFWGSLANQNRGSHDNVHCDQGIVCSNYTISAAQMTSHRLVKAGDRSMARQGRTWTDLSNSWPAAEQCLLNFVLCLLLWWLNLTTPCMV